MNPRKIPHVWLHSGINRMDEIQTIRMHQDRGFVTQKTANAGVSCKKPSRSVSMLWVYHGMLTDLKEKTEGMFSNWKE